MTTCIPFLFKPIIYNDNYYVDGGLCGNFPLDYNLKLKSKKYLGIQISSYGKNEHNIESFLDYIKNIYNQPWSPYDQIKKDKKIIHINMGKTGLILNNTQSEKKDIICQGYKETETHFKNI